MSHWSRDSVACLGPETARILDNRSQHSHFGDAGLSFSQSRLAIKGTGENYILASPRPVSMRFQATTTATVMMAATMTSGRPWVTATVKATPAAM
jgi:hypothetical protein